MRPLLRTGTLRALRTTLFVVLTCLFAFQSAPRVSILSEDPSIDVAAASDCAAGQNGPVDHDGHESHCCLACVDRGAWRLLGLVVVLGIFTGLARRGASTPGCPRSWDAPPPDSGRATAASPRAPPALS
jgi:hypothetical protein